VFCTNCGSDVAGVSYCPACGTPVVKSEPSQTEVTKDAKSGSKVGTVLTYVAAAFAVFIFGGAIIGVLGDDSSSETANPSSETASSSQTSEPQANDLPGLGQGIAFPSGVEVSAVSVNTTPASPNRFVVDTDEAKGEIVSVRLYVFNGSDESITISSSSVTGKIANAEYEALAVFSEAGDWYVLETLGPGLGVTIDAFFDIPASKALSGVTFTTAIVFGEEVEFRF
jgi:hypothetical protein